MNEVKIQIPDNCELVKDGNTYIVKEKKQRPPRSWEDFCKRYPKQKGEAYIDTVSNIGIYGGSAHRDKKTDKNICASKREAEAFLALIQLRQLRKVWVGDWEIGDQTYYCLFPSKDKIKIVSHSNVLRSLSFPTEEMAADFLDCFRDLCETAKILL